MTVMTLTGVPTLDTSSVHRYYDRNGLDRDLLNKCNSQQFKFIDGYGEGHFLTLDTHYSSGETIVLTIDSITRTLYVVDKIELAVSSISPKLCVLKLAEPKFYLNAINVNRNYNIIDRRKQYAGTGPTLSPDTTAKTVQQIIEDFVGFSITYNAPTYYPYDVFIQSMTALEAIDKLCASVGLLWTFNRVSSVNTLVIWSVTTPATVDTTTTKDITKSAITPGIRHTAIAFPVLECCIQTPASFTHVYWDGSAAGSQVQSFMPYYPAIIDTSGTLINNSAITTIATNIRAQFQAVSELENCYHVQDGLRAVDLMAKPASLKVTFADYGTGPLTIYSGNSYPYIQLPNAEVLDRQARNWVGYIYQAYKGAVAGFWVVPGFGIDGAPPTTNQYVHNIYSWNYGADGATVRVEWDCANYRWIPLQQQYICPPSEDPDPMDPPPETETYPTLSPGLS